MDGVCTKTPSSTVSQTNVYHGNVWTAKSEKNPLLNSQNFKLENFFIQGPRGAPNFNGVDDYDVGWGGGGYEHKLSFVPLAQFGIMWWFFIPFLTWYYLLLWPESSIYQPTPK